MRVLVCDDHVVFAESLAHLLAAMGTDVVAVTFHPDEAIAVLRREPVDVCVLDVMFGTDSMLDRLAELRAAAPGTRLVLLCSRLDSATLATARSGGVSGAAEKRQPASEIVRVLERVYAGESMLPEGDRAAEAPSVAHRQEASYAQRLASFLTPREREVLSALVRGLDTPRLARDLGIAETTVRCHIQAVLIKLGAHSRLEAATTAVRFGMINPTTGRWRFPVSGRPAEVES